MHQSRFRLRHCWVKSQQSQISQPPTPPHSQPLNVLTTRSRPLYATPPSTLCPRVTPLTWSTRYPGRWWLVLSSTRRCQLHEAATETFTELQNKTHESKRCTQITDSSKQNCYRIGLINYSFEIYVHQVPEIKLRQST